MQGPSFSRPRRSQRVLPKQRLDPHCSVFPDPLHPPSPPPPTISTLPLPASVTDSQYDFFRWRASRPPRERLDPTVTAPVGALNDDYCVDKDLSLGAWYAFMKGFQSEIGSVVFADQNCSRKCRTFRNSGSKERIQRGHNCSTDCDPCNGPYRDRCTHSWASTDVDNDSDFYGMEADEFSEDAEDRSSESHSDSEESDDTCDQCLWNIRTPQCLVNSVSRVPSVTTETSEGEITAEQAANGMDVQGIPWERLPFSREDYRATRVRDNKRESSELAEGLRDVLKEPRRGAQFYDFFKNTRRVRCSIVHFQLRNLAWATSKHDVFVMHEGTVTHWDAAAKRKRSVLDVSGADTSAASGLGIVQISTMIAKDDLLIAGGFFGEVVAKNLKNGAIIHNKRITYDDNAITNAIDIFENSVMSSNNDCYVRTFDMNTFQRKSSFAFETPVNHATRQPQGKLVAVAGDGNPIQVIDGDNGERVAQLHGHAHYSFATGWHPNGRMFATGSQDGTCRVWDVRNMSQSFSVLGARIGAVRSLRFSACGRFLVMAEPRDFVHIFDVNRGAFDTCQEIDLFGEIAGIALTPAAEGLYIAVCDRTYSSLIEYERRSLSPLSSIVF